MRIWGGTKDGVFTVRSTYHLAKTLEDSKKGSSSRGIMGGDKWRKIWQIREPKVVQTFIWKACQNVLPTKENLFRRHITQDSLCPMCGREDETPVHIMWNCLSARDVWMVSNRKLQKCSSEAIDFVGLLEHLFDILSQEEMQVFVMVARQLWFRRNGVIHEGEMLSPSMVIKQARDMLEGYELAVHPVEAEVPRQVHVPPNILWKAPPDDYIKVNWDASIDVARQLMRMGVVARNNRGEVLAMFCATKRCALEPSAAEALAAWQAAQLGLRMQWRKIILEGDAF